MWIELESTPWDPDDPDVARGQRVLGALRRFQLAESAMRERGASLLHVSEPELRALRHVIRRQDDELLTTPTDVAHYLDVKPTAVTIAIDHLERAGWVERRPHPNDRRSLVLWATDAAQQHVGEIYGAVYDTMIEVAERLDDAHAESTASLLEDLADALDTFAPVAANS